MIIILSTGADAEDRGFRDFLTRFREAPLPLVIDIPILESFDPGALTRIGDADVRRHIFEKLPGAARDYNTACLAIDEFFDPKRGVTQTMPEMYYYARLKVSDKFHSVIALLNDNEARFPMPARYYVLMNFSPDGAIIDSIVIAWAFSLIKLQREAGKVGGDLSIEMTLMGFDPEVEDLRTAKPRDRELHYSRIGADGRVISEQLTHYPCAGTFVNRESGKAFRVDQNENHFTVMFGDPKESMRFVDEPDIDQKKPSFGFARDGVRHRAEFRKGMNELHVTNLKTGNMKVYTRDTACPVW